MPRIATVPYIPRAAFMPFHERFQRWATLVCHRRAGKTVATVNDIISRATYSKRNQPRYAYIAPFYSQAKQIAWDYLKYYTREITAGKPSESALSVNLFNGARITLYGADNPDSMRGLYFDGVAVDEYGNCRPNLWTEILRPALSDRRGWALFIGTPHGPNHFYDVWEQAIDDPYKWFTMLLRASESGILPQEELDEMRQTMTPDEYESEMECSWFASVKGAFYGEEIKAARIGNFPPVPGVPSHYVFDLGFTDTTGVWRWQETANSILCTLASEWESKPVKFYIDWLHEQRTQGFTPGEVYLPHDAKAKSFQTGKSTIEQFHAGGVRPRLVPMLGVQDGIQVGRKMFPQILFDEQGCHQGLKALKAYQREFDEEKKVFRDRPLHNWASNLADAFRYLALVAKKPAEPQPAPTPGPIAVPIHYSFTLDQMFATRPSGRRRI